MEKTYDYSPLVEDSQHASIRILELHQGLGNEPLKISLEPCKLGDSTHQYEALSYCWGDSAKPCCVRIKDRSLRIGWNLHAALLRLRQPDKSRRLWVDAICINQQSADEKTQQIPFMARIYRQATCVIVWLGEDSEKSDGKLTFDFIQWSPDLMQSWATDEMYKHESYDDDDETLVGFFNKAKSGSTEDSSSGPYSTDLLHQFFTRPWFTRRWVIQEMGAASEAQFHCGAMSIDYEAIRRFFELFGYLGTSVDLDQARELIRCKTSFGKPDDLLSALNAYHDFCCQDDRDRVAALLGLWDGETRPWTGFKIDYALSVEENYLALAAKLVSAGECLSVLRAADNRHTREPQTGLPTWVPDWREPFIAPITTRSPKIPSAIVRGRYLEVTGRRCFWFKEGLDDGHDSSHSRPRPRQGDFVFTFDAEGQEISYVLRPVPGQENLFTMVCKMRDVIWRSWGPHGLRLLKSRKDVTTILIA